MVRMVVAAVACIVAVGCGDSDRQQAGPAAAESPRVDAEDATGAEVSGEQAYEMVCASCHETGAGGAPVTGDADSWSGRSPLWEAVLVEHAENGYLAMPARGGATELPDAVVSRATEYMMLRTYPALPRD